MKQDYQIGDKAYMVTHCPFWPTEEEKLAIEESGRQVIDVAEGRVARVIFPTLPKAIVFARKAVKGSFWGSVEVDEVILTNPYRDVLPDHRLKPSAREWESVEGGYSTTIEKN